jgi:hypothetical protein
MFGTPVSVRVRVPFAGTVLAALIMTTTLARAPSAITMAPRPAAGRTPADLRERHRQYQSGGAWRHGDAHQRIHRQRPATVSGERGELHSAPWDAESYTVRVGLGGFRTPSSAMTS